MPYRPKYCCQCGEKIERTDWKFWTSGRFCELCETEFGLHDKISPAIAGLGILIGLLGFGNYFRPIPSANVAPSQFISKDPQNYDNKESKSQTLVETNRRISNVAIENRTVNSNFVTSAVNKITTKPTEQSSNVETDTVYICGAQTKKGTPCSRRVKGGGRCWQHTGQIAMHPQEKLILGNK